MFLIEETLLALPVECAEERMIDLVEFVGLQGVSDDAFGEGRQLLIQAGVAGVSKRVEVQVLPAQRIGGTLVVPIRWVATGPSGVLFPQLDANLEIWPSGPDESALRLLGSYRPPLGGLGERLDRLLLHRVAEATSQALLRDLADELTGIGRAPEPRSDRQPGPCASEIRH